MDYQLIAFDMDGTLLDDKKQILPDTLRAIHEATEAGKVVAIASGRSPRMIELYREQLPDVRYAICISGASILDLREGRLLMQESFDPKVISRLRAACEGEDYVLEVFSGMDAYMQKDQLSNLEPYGVGQFRKLYETVSVLVDDIEGWVTEHPDAIAKYNVHARGAEACNRIIDGAAGLPATVAITEGCSAEFSPAGVSKGTALKILCEQLDIPVEKSIAVGDSGNDVEMIRAAGLGVAMGNATPDVLAAANVTVSDNNAGGCAEAIRKYLLG
ncbi:MAG: HAD family hydrolase [Tractidigestivibacter sp.]|jgi:Cof subfamily protein (haloacid dehalogenase superfamily)|uniref:HAD family hydrolase n=1 Tax=Tractidigestivibacter sp. TaxID=2847320 RepID=UPI003D8E06BD